MTNLSAVCSVVWSLEDGGCCLSLAIVPVRWHAEAVLLGPGLSTLRVRPCLLKGLVLWHCHQAAAFAGSVSVARRSAVEQLLKAMLLCFLGFYFWLLGPFHPLPLVFLGVPLCMLRALVCMTILPGWTMRFTRHHPRPGAWAPAQID